MQEFVKRIFDPGKGIFPLLKLVVVMLGGYVLYLLGSDVEFLRNYTETSVYFLVGAITVEEFARKIKIGGGKK